MRKVEFYDQGKTYIYPTLKLATPERIQADYPATTIIPHLVITDQEGKMLYSILPVSTVSESYDVPAGLAGDDLLAAIEEKMNAPAAPEVASPEERIAAALEFQNLMNL